MGRCRCRPPQVAAALVAAYLSSSPLHAAASSASCSADGATSVDGLATRWRPPFPSPKAFDEDNATADYLATCKAYGIRPNTDVLNRLQLGVQELNIQPTPEDHFGDLELRALARLLLYDDGRKLAPLRSLDLSRCALGESSMLLVASLLRHPASCLRLLDVSSQPVGFEGMSAIASAAATAGRLQRLRVASSGLGDEGGAVLVELLQNDTLPDFRELDAQNNYFSLETCLNLTKIADRRGLDVNLAGNRVRDEVLNSVTHFIGEIFAIVGTVFLCRATCGVKPDYYRLPVTLYCVSMNTLYMSSTLNHAFFALGQVTVYVFSILDYSGIFFLIAGSYSPFLGILFPHDRWAVLLLRGIWTVAVLGILVVAFYQGPGSVAIRLTLFLLMGWACVGCLHKIASRIGCRGMFWMASGGVLYTAGVPWFVRDKHTLGFPDHSIWHIFVVLATMCHFYCILKYVVPCGTLAPPEVGGLELLDVSKDEAPAAGA